MDRDILAYVVMSITATGAALATAIGAARSKPEAVLVGRLAGVYAAIIGTATSAKRELKKELEQTREAIKNLRGC